MHKIHEKEFTIDDFSHEHLTGETDGLWVNADGRDFMCSAWDFCQITCDVLNHYRELYLETKDKKYWWQMIQLLPSSYNQKRTVMLNYEVLAGIYRDRNAHKLDEWREFCQWIEQLPYSEIITCESEKKLYKVGQYAEGYIEGTIELTEREAEIVEHVINVKNWTVTHREDHSGIFSIEPCETEG